MAGSQGAAGRLACACAALLLLAAGASAQVSISSVSTGGSAGGGVSLVIMGSGFSADQYTGGNVVLVGPYPCNVISHLTSTSVITCETTPGVIGTYQVTVVVDGMYQDSACCFSYDPTLTPTLKSIYPVAGPPASNVKLYGNDVSALNTNCADGNDPSTCVGEITFGDYLCNINPDDVTSVFQSGVSFYSNSNLYQLNCTLPDPTVTPAPGLGVGLSVNVSVHFGSTMLGGSPTVDSFAYQSDATGTKPYMFQLFPVVDSISPVDGSTAGGTVLTLTGRGFPDSSLTLLNNTMSISVLGSPCTLLSSSYSSATCTTASQGTTAQQSLTLPNGTTVYPGMRGIAFEFYNTSSQVTKLYTLGSTVTVESTQHGSYRSIVQTGQSAQTMTTLATVSSAVAPFSSTWPTTAPASSAAIALKAGQAMLLDLAHCNLQGPGFAELAVTVPSSTPKPFSTPDTQLITISTPLSKNTQTIKVLTGSATRSGFSLTVTASSNAALLNNPAAGVQITAAYTGKSATFSFSLAATEDQISTIATNALGKTVSVSKAITFSTSVNNIVYQFGVTTTSVPSFALSNQQLVLLPAGPVPQTPTSSPGTALAGCPAYPAASGALTLAAITNSLSISSPVAIAGSSLGAAPTGGANGTVTLSFVGDTSGNSVAIPLGSNSSVIYNAIKSQLGVTPDSVSVQGGSSTVYDGVFVATRWRIAMPYWMGNAVPVFQATASGLNPSTAAVSAVTTYMASTNMTGTFRLGYGTACANVTIDVNAMSPSTIQAAIESLPLPTGIVPLSVTVAGSNSTGFQVTVVFDPATNAIGSLALLNIQDASALVGTQLSVSVTKIRDGSTALFMVLPTEITQVPVQVSAPTVGVSVNSVPAACSNPATCVFTYNSAKTATISSISPATTVSFGTATSVSITLTGSFLSASLSNTQVTVGATACAVSAASATSITCSLPNTAHSGKNVVNVNIAPLGFASDAPTVNVQVMAITAVSPTSLSTTGWTLVNVTSAGIDTTKCDNNALTIGGVSCAIVSCAAGTLTAAYPGGTASSSASVVISLPDPANAGQFLDSNTWTAAVSVAAPAASYPAVTGLTNPPTNGAGGLVTATLATGMAPANVTSTFLIPASALTGTVTYAALSAAFAAQYPCTNTTATGASTLTCNSGALPNAIYYFGVVYSPAAGPSVTLVFASTPITTTITVTAVSPASGSIGGGTTLTITGTGFSTVVDQNVVMLTVPVSSTFLNGVVICDIATATATQLTCVTRANLAADATGADAMANDVVPLQSPSAPIVVSICPVNLTDTNKYACWSNPRTARANCTANPSVNCNFAYVTSATPYISSVAPISSQGGLPIKLTNAFAGSTMTGVTQVLFYSGKTLSGSCSGVTATASSVTGTLPALPAGAYSVVAKKANGELSVVDPALGSVAAFLSEPYLTGLSSNIGSLAGGNPLTILANATNNGLTTGFNAATPANNVITIGNLPCVVASSPAVTANSLTCTPSSALGKVWAEYWALSPNVYGFPDLGWLSQNAPVLTRFETSAVQNWGSNSPDGGQKVPQTWFADRFTFYLSIPAQGNYTFFLNGDDYVMLLVNDQLLGQWTFGLPSAYSIILAPGFAKMQVVHKQNTGGASVSVTWDNAKGSTAGPGPSVAIPWSQVTAIQPGTLVPLQVSVNGVPAIQACPAAATSAASGAGLAPATEPKTIPAGAGGVCGYVYSDYFTPQLTAVPYPQPTTNNPATLTLTGQLLGGSSSNALYTASVGGVAATPSVAANGSGQNVTIPVPSLPAGTWPVVLATTGYGNTRTPFAYNITVTNVVVISSTTVPSTTVGFTSGSVWGGATLAVTGAGFVPTTNSYGKTMTITYTSGDDLNAASWTATVVSCTSSTYMTVAIGSWFNASYPSPSQQLTSTIKFTISVFSTVPDGSSTLTGTLSYPRSVGYTPTISSFTQPAGLTANTGNQLLTVTWYTSSRALPLVAVTSNPATASMATVTLVSGNSTFSCGAPYVTASATFSGSSGYKETLQCTLPSYLPAAPYTVSISHPYVGVGWSSTSLTVPLSQPSISPVTGSLGGGLTVTITAVGFSTNPSDNTVLFGTIPCTVLTATTSQLTCSTGAYTAATSATVPLPLSVSALPGAPTATIATQVLFTYDPTLTDTITAMNTTRGSTAGGTPLLITGTFKGSQAHYSVLLGSGGATCAITSFSATQITCTTSAPPSPMPLQPLPVLVQNSATGAAIGNFTYQYVNLWSRRSTWGGSLPPIEGDSVYIPTGATVLLDISPPRLYLLIVQGNLVFDTAPNANLQLQANYILINGGNLSVGTASTPYAGNALITIWGAPNDIELPLYGNKVIAIRDGWMTLHGQHKNPTWTQLNATANPKDTSITVNGLVNWLPGDRIVIASSSFYASDVDEVLIASVVNNTAANTSTIFLQLPLNYTHLGVVLSGSQYFPGDDRNTVLDMRAEVAVLTRNVVVEGDPTSAQYQFGASVMISTPAGRPRAGITYEQAEFRQMGKAFLLGRYALHWHMTGDLQYKQYIRGCAIYNSYNRANTVHGTQNALLDHNVAYNIMGHTFFLEDSVETGNIYDSNLGILTLVSNALLNTDTHPATFWVTHPNNTYRNNVAAGSLGGYGFWYQLLPAPTGPSANTPNVCPRTTPLKEFTNNRAHSNLFYGLRVHPEFYPRVNPCAGDPLNIADPNPFIQVPAVFNGLTSYKNGMAGAIVTQVGLVRFNGFVLADNGAGPQEPIVNGKDNGANYQVTWVVDDRSRVNTDITNMAGLQNSMLIAQTAAGMVGTAGQWPSPGRKITGVITQSPPEGVTRHTALASLVNVTFVNYTGGQFWALESCGICKTYQGGSTTFTAGIKWINPPGVTVAMSQWSWGHQGIFNDTDGTLLNGNSLPTSVVSQAVAAGFPASFATTGMPGATWHSAINNDMFRPSECVYVRGDTTPAVAAVANNAALCNGGLNFRRVMMNRHAPPALEYLNLWLTDLATNRSSYVFFQHYNEDGYQYTVAATRDYWTHWDINYRLDPSALTYHKMDPLNSSGYVYLTQELVQREYDVTVNGQSTVNLNLTALPNASSANGAAFYNKSFTKDTWMYGNTTYNSTTFTMFLAGTWQSDVALSVLACPVGGCSNAPPITVDLRNGTLLWSDPATWTTEQPQPVAGANVTIPFGWNLVIDVDTPVMSVFIVQGNVTFSTTKATSLNAYYVLVQGPGYLWAGQRNLPQPAAAPVTISLSGTRETPDFAINNDLNLGSKVLAAFGGGKIDLFGAPVGKRWTRLATTATAASNTLTVVGTNLGWAAGQQLIVMSSSWNPWQAEVRSITAVATGTTTTTLTLDQPLTYDHWAKMKSYAGAPSVIDMRVEVGMLSSNILITAADGATTFTPLTGELFGARVIVAGNSSARIDNVAVKYGGQAGLQRPSIYFQRLLDPSSTAQPADALPNGGLGGAVTAPTYSTIANPSFLTNSALWYNMDSAFAIRGDNVSMYDSSPITLKGNVMWYSYDISTVDIETRGNTIVGNLAGGTYKEMAGKSTQDMQMPATYNILFGDNTVQGNVASGSERLGFMLYGPSCGANATAFSNNTIHSSVAGMWLQSSDTSAASGCTAVTNTTIFMSWDFGIITTNGITTNVHLDSVNILDTKHAGALMLRTGDMFDPNPEINMTSCVFAGASGPEVCSLCNNRTVGLEQVVSGPGGDADTITYQGDDGCAHKVTRQSYNQMSPFTPAMGLLSSAFAIAFTPGPERKAWDQLMGYPLILGIARHYSTTFADFQGASCSAGTYALSNHVFDTDAFHPHHFWATNRVNVPDNALVLFNAPDPGWRDEAHCGVATFTRPDNSVILLNCGGPKHALFSDMDGSMLNSGGVSGGLAGSFLTQRVFPYDQGTPLADGPCVWEANFGGYQCRANVTTFTTPPMDLTQKPNPLPPSGIFGDPQLFVFESRDPDTETRDFSPVFFNVSGSIDLVITPFDHGWCFGYTCNKRISNFWTYLPTGTSTNITFTGTPPKNSRVWFPYADPNAEIVLAMSFQGLPLRKFIWSATNGRFPPPSNAIPLIGDNSTGHGSFYWDQSATILYLKMKGGQEPLEIRTDNAVMVSATLTLDVNSFFDNQATFLSAMSYVMGIDSSRMKIVNIVAGSTVSTFAVYTDTTTPTMPIANPTYTTTNNAGTSDLIAADSLNSTAQAAAGVQNAADNAAAAAAAAIPGASSPAPAPPPPPAPSPATTTDLASGLSKLATASGIAAFDAQSGMTLTNLAIDPSALTTLSPSDLAAITAAIAQVNNLCWNPPCPSGTTPVGGVGGATPSPSPSPSPDSSSNSALSLGAIIGIAVGGAAVLAAALAGAAVYIKRKDASRRLVGPNDKAGVPGSDPLVVEDFDSPMGASPGPQKSRGSGNRVTPTAGSLAEEGRSPRASPRESTAGAAATPGLGGVLLTSEHLAGSPGRLSSANAPPARKMSLSGATVHPEPIPPLGYRTSGSGATNSAGSAAAANSPLRHRMSGGSVVPSGAATVTAGGPRVIGGAPGDSSPSKRPTSPTTEDPEEKQRFMLPGAPSGASINYKQYKKLAGGADGANIMGSGGEKEHKDGGAPPSPSGEGSPRNRAALGGDSPANVSMPTRASPPAAAAAAAAAGAAASAAAAAASAAAAAATVAAAASSPAKPVDPKLPSPAKPFNRLPALGAQKAQLAPLAKD